MAVTTSYPGVYIDEVSSGVRPIESAGTSTAAFIGKTVKGPVGEPTLIFKWSEYKEQFGDIEETGSTEANAMSIAVYTFFLNGGGAAYIINNNEETEEDVEAETGDESGEDESGGNESDDELFESLEKIRDINIICLPGSVYPDDRDIIDAAINHAEKMKNRMVIVDLKNCELKNEADVIDEDGMALNPPSSIFSAAYYPWIVAANPLYKREQSIEDSELASIKTFTIAPSSFVAGMWAKIDGKRGVWKAPAGVETALLGVAELAYIVDDARQGILNPLGINCIRRIPGAGPVIWGSRTLATKADPEWRYVPVRRTASMIEESIYNNIQWAVFEPNDHRLWASLRVNIDAFMNGLWRAGAFQGEKASDAYFVRCNLGDTMTQGDIDTGKVIVEVGFAPLKPAEFVIITIQQKVAQQ